MFLQIISYIYLGPMTIILTMFILLTLFWLIFVVNRLNHYFRSYNRSVSYNSLEMDMNAYNYRIKYIVYLFLLLLIISELIGTVSFCLFIIGYRIETALGVGFNISLNCTDSYIGVWEIQTANPLIALLLGIRNATLLIVCILLIDLLKFISQAYQFKPNINSVKCSLVKCFCIFPVVILPCVSPQTHVLSIITFPICASVLLYFLSKNKKLFFLILKWRCDDAFILRDNTSYMYHSRIRRNATISLNLLYSSLVILFLSLFCHQFLSLILILLTEKSTYFTKIYNFEMNLSFLDCHYQHVVYKIRIILDSIIPIITLIALSLYSILFFAVSIGLITARIFRN